MTAWHGSHLVERDGDAYRLVERVAASQDAQKIAQQLAAIRRGEILETERRLAKNADGPVQVFERRLSQLGELEPDALVPELPVDAGAEGYTRRLLHEALLVLAVEEAHGALGGPDLLIVHEVRALDDVVRTMNLLSERLREWYAVHAPEVNARVKDHGELARLVANTPDPLKAAQEVGVQISGLGVEAPPADAALVARFAQGYVDLMGLRSDLETRLEDAVKEVAPALGRLLPPIVAARMIAQAGGLERLAFMPAGTVQTLGAENALFRHLREGAAPPKHGILFQHESVYTAPWWVRGRIARALSGKVAQAARLDAFKADPEAGKRLRLDFDERVKEIHQRVPRPPARGKRRHDKNRSGPVGAAPRTKTGRRPS